MLFSMLSKFATPSSGQAVFPSPLPKSRHWNGLPFILKQPAERPFREALAHPRYLAQPIRTQPTLRHVWHTIASGYESSTSTTTQDDPATHRLHSLKIDFPPRKLTEERLPVSQVLDFYFITKSYISTLGTQTSQYATASLRSDAQAQR